MQVFLLHSNEPTLSLLLERLHLPHGTRLTVQQEKQQPCIIHWGCYHAEKASRLLLQPIKCQLRANHARKAVEVLKLHGIHAELHEPELEGEEGEGGTLPLTPQGYSYEFIVPVFHLQALTLFQRKQVIFYGAPHPSHQHKPQQPAEFRELLDETPSYHAIRAKREAIKAIYALGLDFGVVRIGVGKGGQLHVLELETVPKLNERLAELFAEALHRFAEELMEEAQASGPGRSVMLGADPEFLLRNERGKVKFASEYLEKEGPVGCDAIVLPSFRKIYPLAELRPEPSRDIDQLLRNLHRTMQMASRRISDESLAWVAGGMPVRGFPLGGHIHFSGVPLNSELLRVLDNYLALPLVLLEEPTTTRRKPKYGFLGDFRRQRHGGFEYRVLASWLVSPKVTRGVLALSKLIADHYHQLKLRPLDEPVIQEAYYVGDKQRIRPLLPGLWNDLVRLPSYRKYEAYIVPLKSMMLRMEGWGEQEDIRARWKIGPFARKEVSSINS